MKTNYDHIVEGGVEALADIVVNHTCQSCSFRADCNADCLQGVILWLEQAREEPDSWVKWDEDAEKSTNKYWGCEESSCASCPSMVDGKSPSKYYGVRSCTYAMIKDLALRAKKLRSVE